MSYKRKKPKIRVYKPPTYWFLCACGCGRSRFGRPQARYYEKYCRVRAFLARKKANRSLEIQEKDRFLTDIRAIGKAYRLPNNELSKSHL
jgi:hypothetical protein